MTNLPSPPSIPAMQPPTQPQDQGSFWDDPSVRPPSSDFARFELVGDTYGGTIAKLQKRTFNPGTPDERTAPEFIFSEEDAPSLTAGQTLLQQALWELRPGIGDKLQVTLTKIEKRGAKTLKRFRVEVTRQNGHVDVIDRTDN